MNRIIALIVTLACTGILAKAQSTCNASMTWTQAPNTHTVTFTNTSTVAPALPPSTFASTARFVEIGGQYYSSTPNYTHTFPGPGTYTVIAGVSYLDSVGTIAVTCQDTTIYSVVVAPQPCALNITSFYGTGMTRNAVANGGIATPGTIYSWDFGDGSPAVNGVTASHTYAAGGSYPITLTATGSGCTTTVNSGAWIGYNSINCAAASTGINHWANYNGPAGFTANASPVQYNLVGIHVQDQWNFGDGSPTTTWTVGGTTHSYAASGTYSVTVTTRWIDSVTSAVLCTKSASSNVNIVKQMVEGTVQWDSSLLANGTAKVWLINYDPQTNLLVAVDSTVVTGTNYAHFYFLDVPDGTYRTKAQILGQSSGIAGFVPTYRDSSLTWSGAQTFVHYSGPSGPNGPTYTGAIYMRQGLVTTGPGFVGGSVLSGANKGTADGDPVANQLVFLRDATTGSLVQSAYTNNAGQYSFSNLPLGSYTVYPEAMNYATTPSTPITLTTSNTSVSSILFKKDDVDMDIKQVTASVRNATSGSVVFTLTPNPTSGKLALIVGGQRTGQADVRVLSVTGQVVFSSNISISQTASLDLSHLPAGVYSVQVATANGTGTARVAIAR